jgi:hypothetical protein
MKPYNKNLTPKQKEINEHGDMLIFNFSAITQGLYKAPPYFPTIESFAKIKIVSRDTILVPENKIVKGLYKGAEAFDLHFGFPTFQNIPHTSKLLNLQVFQNNLLQSKVLLNLNS